MMSNSSKQRSFLKDLLKELQTQGEEHNINVSMERGKHPKLILSSGAKRQSVTISSTPKNRNSAQRAALADIRRALANLNPLAASSFDGRGMLQMIGASSEPDGMIDSPSESRANNLRELLKFELEEDDLRHVCEIVEAMLSSDQHKRDPANPHTQNAVSSILRPSYSHQSHPVSCQSLVGVRAVEKPLFGNHFTLRQAIESILSYYSHCRNVTRIGVVVTDVWRPSDIDRSSFEFDYWELNGLKTFFILVSGNSIYRVNRP